MTLKEYLLRIHLCSGIGLVSENKIFEFIKINHQIPSDYDLMLLLNLNFQKTRNLYQLIYSDKITRLIEQNLCQFDYITILDETYPEKLREIYQPPLVLFYKGDLNLLNYPILGVVGARKHSQYANEVLNQLLPTVIQKQIVTVSGLAHGVDSLCHRITIGNHGKTIGVIGTGLDICYPHENQQLQQEMMKNHLVISEFKATSSPRALHFPLRNRIIAGLCDSILVVEARKKSGSLITANLALQENRNVLVVPGKINSELSVGCNLLFKDGAKPIFDSQDILEEFRMT